MREHTEGPWEAIPEKGSENFAHSIYSEGYKGLLIARCNQNGAHDADALLIAAAPDLLEALKRAEQLYLDGILNTPSDEIQRVHDLRRAAIARAEGRADA